MQSSAMYNPQTDDRRHRPKSDNRYAPAPNQKRSFQQPDSAYRHTSDYNQSQVYQTRQQQYEPIQSSLMNFAGYATYYNPMGQNDYQNPGLNQPSQHNSKYGYSRNQYNFNSQYSGYGVPTNQYGVSTYNVQNTQRSGRREKGKNETWGKPAQNCSNDRPDYKWKNSNWDGTQNAGRQKWQSPVNGDRGLPQNRNESSKRDDTTDTSWQPVDRIENWAEQVELENLANSAENDIDQNKSIDRNDFNCQQTTEPKSLVQKLLEISRTGVINQTGVIDQASGSKLQRKGKTRRSRSKNVKAIEVDDESDYSIMSDYESEIGSEFSDRRSSTYDCLLENENHVKLTTVLSILTPDVIIKCITRAYDFLLDESARRLVFDDVTDRYEIDFLRNIKSAKRILKHLDPECAMHYRKLVALNEQSSFNWHIKSKKKTGIKTKFLEYIKIPQKTKMLKDPDAPTKVTPSFQKDSLEKILDFMEDDHQASLPFNGITDVAQVRFLLSLRRVNGNKNMNQDCWRLYKQIMHAVRIKKHLFKWGVTCKNIKEKNFLVYHKVPPDGDVNLIKTDSDGKQGRVRVRKRSRVKSKEAVKEQDDNRGKKDNMISFLPQTEKQDDNLPEIERDVQSAPTQRVNKEKAKILEGLAKPVVASKAERMMMMMGWRGGALGSKGDGIVEPIAPNLLQIGQAGLGHVRDQSPKARGRRRAKADDFEIGVWEPVKPKPIRPMTKRAKRKSLKESMITNALKTILDFVSDDRQLEVPFAKCLASYQRKVIHELVQSFADDEEKAKLSSAEQKKLYESIVDRMDCVLYTESRGEKGDGTRQLILYKTVSDDTYLLTPEDLKDEIVEPSQFIGEDSNDCVIIDDEDAHENKPQDIEMINQSNNYAKTAEEIVIDDDCIILESENDTDKANDKDVEMKLDSDNIDSDDEIIPDTFNTYSQPENSSAKFRIVEKNGKIFGIRTSNNRILEKRSVPECPKNSACQMYMLCRKFLPVDVDSLNEHSNDSSESESVEVPKHIRKRPHKTEKGVDLIENRMKNIEIPRQEYEKESNQNRIVRLLVSYLTEYIEDKEAIKLRFLGDFKVVDRIIINSFMSELNECISERSIDRLSKAFAKHLETLEKLKKMIFDGPQTLLIERNDEGPFSTYTAYKVESNTSSAQ